MKRLIIEPDGWECKFCECPPGFFVFNSRLCLKSEYGHDDAYNEAGEYFWGGTQTEADRAQLIVQPCAAVWREE